MNATGLSAWESFYVIVGSSAGALIGLQFVVITLIAERPPLRAEEAGAAFATPSVVHFAVVLFLSAIISAPWHTLMPVAVLCGLLGVGGIIYAVIVARRLKTQTVYQPVLEDRIFHIVLPLVAYVMLAASALLERAHAGAAAYIVGGATLLLLFVGIHNAWDAVTYHVFTNKAQPGADGRNNKQ